LFLPVQFVQERQTSILIRERTVITIALVIKTSEDGIFTRTDVALVTPLCPTVGIEG